MESPSATSDTHTNARRLARAALLAVMIAFTAQTQADADLWGHVLFGRDIVAARAIPRADAYSFTADLPWINHEWLSEILMYRAFQAAGSAGLVLLKMLLVGGLLWLVWLEGRRSGARTFAAGWVVLFTAVGAILQTLNVRPQLFSLVLFGGLLAILTRAEEGQRRMLVAIPPLMLVWVNLHGGWIVGAGVLGLWSVLRLWTPDRRKRDLLPLAALVAGLAATAVNPYGVGMWRFLYQTVGLGRADIIEWSPFYRLGVGYLAFWIGVASIVGLSVALYQPTVSWKRVAMVALLGLMSLQVARLMAFFVIVAAFLLNRPLAALLPRVVGRPALSAGASPKLERFAVLAIASILLTSAVIVAAERVRCLPLNEDDLPEPQALQFARSYGLRGRVLTFFNWGEYVIWHLSPDVRVSIDGRRETVYSERVRERHLALYWHADRAVAVAEALNPDAIWLPHHLPAVPALRRAGWSAVFEGPRSIILSRERTSRPPLRPTTTACARCFPGP